MDAKEKEKLAKSIWGEVTKDSEKKAKSVPKLDPIPIDDEKDEKKEIKFELKDEEKEEAKDDFEIPTDDEISEIEEEEEKEEVKPYKPGQIKALRTQRDEAKAELEKAQAKINELEAASGKVIPEDLKEKVGDKTIPEIIEENIKLKTELEEYGTEKDTLKSKLREVNIENDPDFIHNYHEPIVNALDGFDAVLSEVDPDGNILYPDHIEKLKAKLFNFKDGAPVANAKQAKAVISAFSEEYRNATGEDYDAPSPTEIMRGIREISSLYTKRQEAKQEWEEQRESAKADSLKAQQQKESERMEVLRKERVKNTQKAIDEFDYSSYEKLGSKKEVRDLIIESADQLEKMISDPSSQPTWDEMVTIRFKANNFDKLLKLVMEGEAEDPDESHHGSTSKVDPDKLKKSNNEFVDWLDPLLSKPINR